MNKDTAQPQHILPRRIFVPHEETDVLGQTVTVQEFVTADQLPTVSFYVAPALIEKNEQLLGSLKENSLALSDLAEVGQKIFDIPFDLLPNTLSKAAGRSIDTLDIAAIEGTVAMTKTNLYTLEYTAHLHSGEKVQFLVDVMHTPTEEGQNIREAFQASRQLSILFEARLDPLLAEQYRVLKPYERGAVEHNGKTYAFQTREYVSTKDFPAILINDKPVLPGLPIYDFIAGVTKPNGIVSGTRMNRRVVDKVIERARKIARQPKTRFEQNTDYVESQLIKTPEWEAYNAFYTQTQDSILGVHALIYAVTGDADTGGRVSLTQANGGDILTRLWHDVPQSFIIGSSAGLTEPMTREQWKYQMKSWKERTINGDQILYPFVSVPDEILDGLLDWAESQIVAPIPPYFWEDAKLDSQQ